MFKTIGLIGEPESGVTSYAKLLRKAKVIKEMNRDINIVEFGSFPDALECKQITVCGDSARFTHHYQPTISTVDNPDICLVLFDLSKRRENSKIYSIVINMVHYVRKLYPPVRISVVGTKVDLVDKEFIPNMDRLLEFPNVNKVCFFSIYDRRNINEELTRCLFIPSFDVQLSKNPVVINTITDNKSTIADNYRNSIRTRGRLTSDMVMFLAILSSNDERLGSGKEDLINHIIEKTENVDALNDQELYDIDAILLEIQELFISTIGSQVMGFKSYT